MRKVTASVAMLAAIAFGLTSCSPEIPKEVPSSFDVLTVDTTDFALPLKFSAKMRGESDVNIMPQVSGQVMKINVSEGQQVVKGQTLFVIDSRNAQSELQAAQANLQAAQANLQAAQAQANSAKLEFESNQNLYNKQIVSSYTLENSRNTYRQSQAAVEQARAAVTQAQASVSAARVNLGFCTITAPVSGVVGEIMVRAGDQVSPMTQMTIVSGNRKMEAWFSVTESIIEAAVKEGDKIADIDIYLAELPDVTFVMKNGTEYPHKGRIAAVNGVVDAATGSLLCKATFPNPDGILHSGIQGTVVLPLTINNVIVIPQNAVVRMQDKSMVYKVQPDSTATAVTVTTQDTNNGKDIIITSGLNLGDVIVAEGANNVKEGQRVLFPAAEKSKK